MTKNKLHLRIVLTCHWTTTDETQKVIFRFPLKKIKFSVFSKCQKKMREERENERMLLQKKKNPKKSSPKSKQLSQTNIQRPRFDSIFFLLMTYLFQSCLDMKQNKRKANKIIKPPKKKMKKKIPNSLSLEFCFSLWKGMEPNESHHQQQQQQQQRLSSPYYHHPHHLQHHHPSTASTGNAVPSSNNGLFPPQQLPQPQPNDGSSSLAVYPHSVPSSAVTAPAEPLKRKRGRPRKYVTPEQALAAKKMASSASSSSAKERREQAAAAGGMASSNSGSSKKSQLASVGGLLFPGKSLF